jgi:hypothetical protein
LKKNKSTKGVSKMAHQLTQKEKHYAETMAWGTNHNYKASAIEAAIAVMRYGADAQVEADARKITLGDVQRAQGMIKTFAFAGQFYAAPRTSDALTSAQIVSGR